MPWYCGAGGSSWESLGLQGDQTSQSKEIQPGKPFNITVVQVYALSSNAEEAEVEWFYEDLQERLEQTLKKDVLFIIWDWNAKVGSQGTPGVTGKFGLWLENEAGKQLREFFQENALS